MALNSGPLIKATNKNIKIIEDASMDADVTSLRVQLAHYNLYCIEAVFTGSPVGTLSLEISGSDHYDESATFNTYVGSSVDINGAGSHLFEVSDAGHTITSLKFTRSSGTGTLNASFRAKNVNVQ